MHQPASRQVGDFSDRRESFLAHVDDTHAHPKMFRDVFQVCDVARIGIGEFEIELIDLKCGQPWQDWLIVSLHVAMTFRDAVAAVQMCLDFQSCANTIDRVDRVAQIAPDVPVPLQSFVVDRLSRCQTTITEISQRGIVQLYDLDAGRFQGLCFPCQYFGQMFQKVFASRVCRSTVFWLPVADGNQERARQGCLGDCPGIVDQELCVFDKDRCGSLHPFDDDQAKSGLPLVLVSATATKATRPRQEFVNVLGSPPLAVTDDVQSGLLL